MAMFLMESDEDENTQLTISSSLFLMRKEVKKLVVLTHIDRPEAYSKVCLKHLYMIQHFWGERGNLTMCFQMEEEKFVCLLPPSAAEHSSGQQNIQGMWRFISIKIYHPHKQYCSMMDQRPIL